MLRMLKRWTLTHLRPIRKLWAGYSINKHRKNRTSQKLVAAHLAEASDLRLREK